MREKAVSRNFVHQGTNYAYVGNEKTADSHFHEVRSHLLGMKRTNVNGLPIQFGSKRFDDGTVAHFQLMHGQERVIVDAPVYEPSPNPEPRKVIEEVEQIVPMMRSTDNQWWVACLSGTFEGPYYAFENIYDIPAVAFDDNVEADMDGQLISTGRSEIEEGISLPELYFIGQTGILPPALTTQNVDTGPDYQPSIDDQSEVICQKEDITVNGECPLGVPQSVTVHDYTGVIFGNWSYKNVGSNEIIDEYVVFGAVNTYLPHYYSGRYTSYSHTYNTTAGSGLHSFWLYFGGIYFTGCDFFNVRVPDYNLTAEELALQSARDSFALTGWTGTDGANSNKVFTEESKEMFNGRFALRIEQAYTNRFCCGYTNTVVENTDIRTATDTACEIETDVTTSNTTTTEYSDYFQVDDQAYLLQGPMETHSPTYSTGENMMKYYGTDSIAETTGMMSAVVIKPGDDDIAYHYVGPNNQHELSVTSFIAPGIPLRKHTVADVENLPDGVEFYGEIFLGLVKYEVEIINEE